MWEGFNATSRAWEIEYRRSTDGGASFGGTVNLSNTTEDSQLSAVAASGNNVHVVWREYNATSGNYEILYRRSTDGGANFGGTMNISNTTGLSSTVPAIASSGNNVYIVWEDLTSGNYEILYRRSTDGGANFGGTVNLSNTPGGSYRSAVASSGNNVYIVWMDETSGNVWEILYRRSTDGGANFGGTVNLSNTPGTSSYPAIAATNNLR